MFTLSKDRKRALKNMFIYLGITAFCALFGYIYELNAHGVFSIHMAFGFCYPLVGGVLIYLILYLSKSKHLPSPLVSFFYNAGVATLTVGSYFRGALIIYGTSRDIYNIIYPVVGIILLSAGIISYVITLIISYRNNVQPE